MRSPTSVLDGTTSAVAPSCVVHPSAAAQRLNPPAFVPSSQLVQMVPGNTLQMSGGEALIAALSTRNATWRLVVFLRSFL